MSDKHRYRPLVHLPRIQTVTPDPHLPRGSCRYVYPVEADGARPACPCVSFVLDHTVPGSKCGCGHQAWVHETNPSGCPVSVDDYAAMVEKVEKLQEQLESERKSMFEVVDRIHKQVLGQYKNMAQLKFYVDKSMEGRLTGFVKDVESALGDLNKRNFSLEDRIDAIVDRTSGLHDISTKVNLIDEAHITFEERLEQAERQLGTGRWSPSATAVHNPQRITLPSVSELPLRIDRHLPPWSARVILVPSKYQSFAFKDGTLPERRCSSRNLNQQLTFEDGESSTFVRSVNTAFADVLQGRDWMPLYCVNSEDRALSRLQDGYLNPHLWDHRFLVDNCVATLKSWGEAVFIALQHHELSWNDIRAFPPSNHADDSCWDDDLELDGHRIVHEKSRMSIATTIIPDDGTDVIYKTTPYHTPRVSIVEPSYGSPPPYQSATPSATLHLNVDGTLPLPHPATGLDLLAGTALGEMPKAASIRSSISSAHTSSRRPSSDAGYPDSVMSDAHYPQHTSTSRSLAASIRSFDLFRPDDQHQDKRPRLRTPTSQPGLPGAPAPTVASSASSASSPHGVPATSGPKYVPAGRTKRKVTSVSKHKEPVSYHDWKIPVPKFGHRKERETMETGPPLVVPGPGAEGHPQTRA